MTRYKKVRGKGKKDERIEELQAEVRSLREAAGKGQASDAMPNAKKRPRKYTQHDVRKLAYDYYEFMGGDVLDMQINNERAKARAFASQMRVAEGRDHFGQGAWGPDITIYESRMSGSLLSRLLKQKDQLLDKYAAMMEESLKEQYELEEEGYEAPKVDFTKLGGNRTGDTKPARPEDSPLRFNFSEEEKQAYIDALMTENPNPPYVALEIFAAMEACGHDRRRLTPDMIDLFKRAGRAHEEKARKKAEAAGQPQPVSEHPQTGAGNAPQVRRDQEGANEGAP